MRTLILLQYTINCSQPVSDKIFDLAAFEKFLHERVKVEGRTGNLGEQVSITTVEGGKIEVVSHIPFSGRYLKYLYVYTHCTLTTLGPPGSILYQEKSVY